LKDLTGFKNLTYLNTYRTGVTDAGVKELKQSLPKCHVYR